MTQSPEVPFAPPTQEEVVDLIEYSKRNFLRKPERNTLKRLSQHRDTLVVDNLRLTEQVNQLAAHADRLEQVVQDKDANLRAAKAEIDRLNWEKAQC